MKNRDGVSQRRTQFGQSVPGSPENIGRQMGGVEGGAFESMTPLMMISATMPVI